MNFNLGDVFGNFGNNNVNNNINNQNNKEITPKKERLFDVKKYAIPNLPDEEVVLYNKPDNGVKKYAIPEEEVILNDNPNRNNVKYGIPSNVEKYAIYKPTDTPVPSQTTEPNVEKYAIYKPTDTPVPSQTTEPNVEKYAIYKPTDTPVPSQTTEPHTVEKYAIYRPTDMPVPSQTTEPHAVEKYAIRPINIPVQETTSTPTTRTRYNPFTFNISSILNNYFQNFFGRLNSGINRISNFFFKL